MGLSPANAVAKRNFGGGANRDFVNTSGVSTVVAGTTAVAVLAAAAAGEHLEITEVSVHNLTAAEVGQIIFRDGAAGTIIATLTFSGPADGAGNVFQKFDPPIQLAAAKGVTAEASTAIGDCICTARGMLVTD